MRNVSIGPALAALALAGCTASEESAPSGAVGGGAVQTATLTGLYESGDGARRNQLCMVERDGGAASFGFVTWSAGTSNCSGSGPATRDGDRIMLRLDGDESCTLEARIDGRRVTMPSAIPDACKRYYCGAGAELTGVTFDKVGGEAADALKATDLAGDRLCG
jgi:hypothetical protein